MRIGIDFDDVIANTMDAIVRMHNEEYGTTLKRTDFTSYKFEEVWGGTRNDAIKKVNGFFAKDQRKEIEPMIGAVAAVRSLKEEGHELYIITGRSENDVAETERWIMHHFENIFTGVHYAHFFTLNKNEMPQKKVDICRELGIELMIDDNLPTAMECAEAGIKTFLFDQYWNAHDSLPEGIVRVHSWEEILENIADISMIKVL